MKFFILFLCFFVVGLSAFSQTEEVGPLMANPELIGKTKSKAIQKVNQGTFDSTILYVSDTLELPFFDEFTKNHFQQYNADFSDPGVTSDKKYRLLDNLTSQPIAVGQFYTDQVTFRRTYDIVTSTYVDASFLPTQLKVGDLSNYPVNYATTDLYPPYYIYDTIGAPDVSDTVWITSPGFYQDSATQFFVNINDPNAYWLDDFAYHNYRYAFEPRSLGVVTFDGLNADGYPYAIGTSLTNYADVLTSKPLNLSSYDASDSLYISFLYQAQGFGDVPETSDSLILEFYAKDLDQWKRVWSDSGQVTSEFKVANINLKDAQYFKKGFQFRFRNYGALSGSLDHFHIDYVQLKFNAGYQDTLFRDLAFVYPVGSLLKTYTSVPWDHFKNNASGKMNDSVQIVMHSGGIIPANNQNGLIEVSYNSNPEGNYTLFGQILAGGPAPYNYLPRTTVTSFHDVSTGYVFDVTKLGNEQTFDVLATASTPTTTVNPVELTLNDSTSATQYFGNYYSYDDGTAEAAYGPTGSQARLAIHYTAYEADSLIGMQMHFVPSVSDVSNNLFLMTVWEDNGGVPGAVIYEDDVFFPRSPEYTNTRNVFINYYFKDTLKLPVGTSYFIGWRQLDPERLNIGLDKNLDNSDQTFYSVDNGNSWVQSTISGSVMMHPIYSTALDVELGISENKVQNEVVVYPNPTDGDIHIDAKGVDFSGAEVYNVFGEKVLTSADNTFSMSANSPGIYYIKVFGTERIFKIVKL
jgi:hypothetical protein